VIGYEDVFAYQRVFITAVFIISISVVIYSSSLVSIQKSNPLLFATLHYSSYLLVAAILIHSSRNFWIFIVGPLVLKIFDKLLKRRIENFDTTL